MAGRTRRSARSSLTRLIAVVATVAIVVGIAAIPAYASVQLTVFSQSQSFSPNADGQEDTLQVVYCLSEGANLDVVVKDNALTPVRTLESGVSHSAGCDSVTWDGKNTSGAVVADGLYSLAFHASGASGVDDGTFATRVDTRAPGVLTTPHPGATLSGTASFVFTPTAGFTDITNVSVDCIGQSDTPAGDGTFTASGDSSVCTEGPNSIAAHVSYTDGFGASHSWNSPTFSVTVTNPVVAEMAGNLQSQSFSPNGDGQEDTLTAWYCVSRDSTVDAVVKNSVNVVVRTLQSHVSISGTPFPTGNCLSFSGNAASVTWDGKNDANVALPIGNYSVQITATDPQLNTSTATYATAIDTRLPGTLTQPAAGAHLSGSASPFVFTPTAGFGPLDSVNVGCLGDGTLQADGTWTGHGDTTGCGPNLTTLSASVGYTDAFGSLHSWQSPAKTVSVAARVFRPANDVSRSFSPGTDGQEDSVTANYCLTDDATVTITVHDAAHTLVRTLATNDPQTAVTCYGPPYQGLDNAVEWDGKNTGGAIVANGAYTIDIHAVAGTEQDDLSIPTVVDTRVPGTLTQPASGATLTDTASFAFTPTAGFTGISEVYVDCIDAASFGPEADGTFIGSGDTNSCASGPVSLHSHVTWTDSFGSVHYWSSPTGVPATLATFTLQLGGTDSKSFSPNGDGQEDILTQGYCLSGDATVDAVVENAANVVVRTLFTGASQAGNPCFSNGNNTAEWDGTDASGHVVADGAYTIVLHAVAVGGGSSADLSIPTTVDNATPGQLTQPSFGQTLQGLVQFSFAPTANFEGAGRNTIQSVNGCFSNDGSCISILNESPDGIWRTTKPASELTTGAADFSWQVTYIDTYGVLHTWTSPVPVALSINSNPDPVVAVGATPISGAAPLATIVHVDLADAPHRPLAYSVNFGDNSAPVTGTALTPYSGGLSLAHTYATPNAYLVTVSVSDGAGGSEQKTLTITALGTEQAPTAALAVSPVVGVAPANVTATFSASDGDSPSLTYSLDFGDGTAARTGTLPSAAVAHTYTQAGTYTVRFAASDGQYTDVRTRSVSIGLAQPPVAQAGDDQTAIVNQPVHFDGSASRPLIGLTSYNWNFGGGSTATGATADHTFTTTGTKTVTLTVHQGATTNTDTMTVVVSAVPTVPGLRVTVTGSSTLVPGADVLVLDSDGIRHPATTDDSGLARIDGLPDGAYTVYAWHDGFLPSTGNATIVNGSATTTIALAAGSVGQTSMTSTPITDIATLQSLGIDPNDAANQNVYQFEIHLAFVDGTSHDVSLGGYATGEGILGASWGGGGGGGSCTPGAVCEGVGNYTIYPQVSYVGATPTVLWMIIPGRAKWLKEFFDVRVVVSNLGSSVFSFQHGTASLGALPAGLSLAPTSTPQTLTHSMPDIPGGQSAQANWVVRGDSQGFYTLGAQYSGSLEPLGVPIHLVASTSANGLHVWGGSALQMTVDTDNTAAIGAPYRVRIQLKNVADVPVFNPSVELLQTGRLNYIYSPGERLKDATNVIQPGATFSTHFFRLVPEISGTLVLSLSFVKKTAGNTDVASTIVAHASVAGLPVTGTHSGTALTLSWGAPPVANITGYRVYFTNNRDTPFPATFIASTAAATRTVVIPHLAAGYYAVTTLIGGVPTMYHTMYGLATAPSAPAAIAGNAAATVKWTAPASNGGSPITGYVVTPSLITATGPVAQAARSFPATPTTQVITGLTNAKKYSFAIAAKNANGTGPAATVVRPIVVGTPIPPVGVTATPALGSAKVTWHASTNANGSPVTGWVVTPYLAGVAKPATSFPAATLSATITGLTNTKSYTFTVAAKNARGTGDISVPTPAIIVGTPNAPTILSVTPGLKKATVKWKAPTANGTPAITGYVVTPYLAGVAKPATTFTNVLTGVISGLTTGGSYTFTVAAKNANGTGRASPASTPVTPT
jgi:flagellar hook assembly protein FlgD/PKD repeat protein